MKKIYLILSVFAIVFTACETDFDVNATWEEVTVVYGLLDAGDGKEVQQIKSVKYFWVRWMLCKWLNMPIQ